MRQARHPLELQDQAQGYHGLVDVAASSGVVQPIGDMAPGFALAAFGRRRLQRSACLKAAESVGDELAILPDGQGLVGYPVWLAKNYPQTFGTLLAATWRKPTLTPSAGFTPARALLRGISARPPAQL